MGGKLASMAVVRVETVPAPLQHSLMFIVVRVCDRAKELGIAPDSTNIFWWTIPFTFNTHRIWTTFLRFQASLKQDFVFPTITEVVLIKELEPLSPPRRSLATQPRGE